MPHQHAELSFGSGTTSISGMADKTDVRSDRGICNVCSRAVGASGRGSLFLESTSCPVAELLCEDIDISLRQEQDLYPCD